MLFLRFEGHRLETMLQLKKPFSIERYLPPQPVRRDMFFFSSMQNIIASEIILNDLSKSFFSFKKYNLSTSSGVGV